MPSQTAAFERKPQLRGVIHLYGFFASVGAGIVLVASAPSPEARWVATAYAGALTALLGTSALYHRIDWSPRVEPWIRRLDHSMIFVLIAGSYTPFGLLALHSPLSTIVLYAVWGAAGAGVVFKLVWIEAPAWLVASVYVAIGWAGVLTFPELVATIGWPGTSLLALGGLLYTVGAVVYALRRPDPHPAVFGYHEIFHSLVVLAAGLHFVVIAGWVV